MVRELGKPPGDLRRPEGLELLADASVQAHALGRREVTVDRLADERVREPPRVRRRTARGHEPQPGGLVERRQDVVRREPGDRCQRRHLELPPQHRGHAEGESTALGERPQTVADHVARVIGDVESARRSLRRSLQRARELLDEERIAVRRPGGRSPPRRPAGRGPRAPPAGARRRPRRARRGRSVSPTRASSGSTPRPAPCRISTSRYVPRTSTRASASSVAMNRSRSNDAASAQWRSSRTHEQRGFGTEPAQRARDRLEELKPRVCRLRSGRDRGSWDVIGEQRCERGVRGAAAPAWGSDPLVGAEHLHPRPVRRRALGLLAAPPAHRDTERGGAERELARDAGLSDARLAHEEHEPSVVERWPDRAPAPGDRARPRGRRTDRAPRATPAGATRSGLFGASGADVAHLITPPRARALSHDTSAVRQPRDPLRTSLSPPDGMPARCVCRAFLSVLGARQ